MSPDHIYRNVEQLGKGDKVPPVEKWNPPLSGAMDMVIQSDGHWVHEGVIIKRAALVRTFSRILKREEDNYYLVTPQEKWQIQVQDAPFLVNNIHIENPGESQTITLSTTTDNQVILDAEHPLWIEYDQHDNPRPYALIRSNLHALINRSCYLQLAEIAEELISDEKTVWKIRSSGNHFLFGEEQH